nr:MAG TPA: hypothetical protein [Caudoviricetes sp.]
MQLTVELEGIDTLARLIAKYLAEGSEFEVSKETNQIFVKVDDQEDGATEKTAVQQVEPVKAEKKEAAAKPQITTAELRRAVMEFTRNNQDNLTKAKEILSGMGIEQLSQLEGDLISQFVEKFVAIGGKI